MYRAHQETNKFCPHEATFRKRDFSCLSYWQLTVSFASLSDLEPVWASEICLPLPSQITPPPSEWRCRKKRAGPVSLESWVYSYRNHLLSSVYYLGMLDLQRQITPLPAFYPRVQKEKDREKQVLRQYAQWLLTQAQKPEGRSQNLSSSTA